MNLKQNLAILIAILLVVLLFFGFDKTTPNLQKLPDTAKDISTVSFAGVERRAFENLENEQQKVLKQKKVLLDQVSNDTAKIALLKDIASTWYAYGQPAMSGYFAQKIAEIENSASSWGICGTTFYSGIEKYSNPLDKQYCSENAIFAFENAVSLNPSAENHRINLALVYVASPPKDNPMQGILMLRQILDKNPESVSTLYHLARLAVQTGQYDKARERLQMVLDLEPEHQRANCLMGKVEQTTKPQKNVEHYLKYCN